jgi:hypothetical protein
MVLGWAIVVLIIYGLFFFNPAEKNDRTYLGSKSLKRLYRQEYGESPHFDGEPIGAGAAFQCMGFVARHRSR